MQTEGEEWAASAVDLPRINSPSGHGAYKSHDAGNAATLDVVGSGPARSIWSMHVCLYSCQALFTVVSTTHSFSEAPFLSQNELYLSYYSFVLRNSTYMRRQTLNSLVITKF